MFDGFVLAEGSYKTYEFHRALLYLEQHMAISKKGLTDSKERDLFVVRFIFSSKKTIFRNIFFLEVIFIFCRKFIYNSRNRMVLLGF